MLRSRSWFKKVERFTTSLKWLLLIVLIGTVILAGDFWISIDSAHAQGQTNWMELPAINSNTSPAISDHGDGNLYAAAITQSGVVAYTSTTSPYGWTNWWAVGSLSANPYTPPILVRDHRNTLHLFARGDDDNLYEAHKVGPGNWSVWQQLTFDGRIGGRFSIALTESTANQLNIHVLYKSYNNSVEYRWFSAESGTLVQSGNTESWSNAAEGTIGSDGANQVFALIRSNNNHLLLQRKSSPWSSSWMSEALMQVNAEQYFDISSVVYFGDAFHAIYAVKLRNTNSPETYRYELQHLRYSPAYAAEVRTVTNYDPEVRDPDGNLLLVDHPKTELIVYRNKLVAAYKDPWGWISYARWDNADPAGPWLGNVIVDSYGRTEHRPALGKHNRRRYLKGNDYAFPNFGDDLFAAINRSDTYSISYVNFSRAIFSYEINTQFFVYDSRSDSQSEVCQNQNEDYAPSLIRDISQDGRPFFTEAGYMLWTLPNWFTQARFKNIAVYTCLYDNNNSGRFDASPCELAKYPIIIRQKGGAFICSGIWAPQSESYKGNLFHELSHTISTHILGLSDNNNEWPTEVYAQRSGIPLQALQEAFALFGDSVDSDCLSNESDDSCPDTRKIGFTGDGNNYDASTRQHSFIGVLTYYFADGDQLRRWIREDQARGDYLLLNKYNWIKENIFRGVEFGKDNAPYNPSL